MPSKPDPDSPMSSPESPESPDSRASIDSPTLQVKKGKRSVRERLSLLDKTAETQHEQIRSELADIKGGLEELERRRQVDSARAAIRHEILINALKRVYEDMSRPSKGEIEAPGGESPQGRKNIREGRKNLERCLGQYMQRMDDADQVKEVVDAGKLCKKYSEALFKTYI